MGLKVIIRINLPYIIRMEKAKEVSVSLSPTDEFSYFKITFCPNIKENKEFYNPKYSGNNCLFIVVEAVTNLYNFNDYKIAVSDRYDSLYTFEVAEDDRQQIFSLVRTRLNEYLNVLNEVTKMFWVEEIPMNPISGVIGKSSQYVFLEPHKNTDSLFSIWNLLQDDYQTQLKSSSIIPIDNSVVNKSKDVYLVGHPWKKYINKAQKALFESEFYEFIIYCAIASESFIKQITTPKAYGLDEDIVLQKLIRTGNNNIIDSYYNVILKYIFGKSLLEVDEALYSNLKKIYKFRNAIIHTGEINEKVLKDTGNEGKEELTFEMCSEMLTKLNQTISKVLTLITNSFK